MPTFTNDEATEYDSRITRLVPGYDLLHSTTAAQLKATLGDHAHILIVGSGTGKEIAQLATLNPTWRFTAQDISIDMLNIGQQRFADMGISERVTIHVGDVATLTDPVDAAICLLVLHFLADNGDKKTMLKAISKLLKPQGQLYLGDLMRPETTFERDAQFILCQQLGLTEVGIERMKHNFEHEFFALDRMRLADLLNESGFNTAKLYFKALSFSGHVIQKR
ncbi:SAM-dependent methyltransferase [Pseudoalteromonas porphyrae]|uniref:class I SAM-dependent methyltransferase n=1 Tax=Pseudoalteromonas TaxID=53246 RepID=UPI0006BAFF24|nr:MULTISPECIES: class I SAM-dependent methyltransferase [Pseudoalteromonas]KPH95567.1 SAM-dependent methyltransferase [Pseudoalteromonas porphyrae]